MFNWWDAVGFFMVGFCVNSLMGSLMDRIGNPWIWVTLIFLNGLPILMRHYLCAQ